MKLKCSNISCNYTWEYKGLSKWYASCPRCKTSVNIKKHVILEGVKK